MTDPTDKPGKLPTDLPSGDPRLPASSAAPLRGDLDAGRGRDKVAYPDPAAAPLGTDDEAAGTPITDEQLRMACAQEDRTDQVRATDRGRTAGATGAISVTGADRRTAAERDPARRGDGHGGLGRLITVGGALLIVLVLVLLVVFAPI